MPLDAFTHQLYRINDLFDLGENSAEESKQEAHAAAIAFAEVVKKLVNEAK